MQAGYRADIDGLRAVAVGLVVAFHAFPDLVPGGFVGVDVFFVVSGFLITGIIQPRIEAGTFSFREFYIRRIRRIFPALIIVLLATLAIGWVLLLPNPYKQLGVHALAGAFFVPNFVFWSEVGYFDAIAVTKPLLHLWSLGVEEQFYLVWPVALILLNRRRKWLGPSLAALVGLSLIYSSFAAWHGQAAGFYSPLSRLWELGVGGLLAVCRPAVAPREWPASVGLALILGSAFFLSETDPFPGLLALIPVAGAAVIVTYPSKPLAARPLVRVGLVSYPLYLWHWPLLSFAAIEGISTPATRLAIVALSCVLSWVTYVAIERPIRSGRYRTVPSLLAGMAAAGALAGVVYAAGGLPTRFPAEIRPVLAIMDYDPERDARVGTCWIATGAPISEFAPECSQGSTLIWGDSHAGRLYAGLQSVVPSLAQFVRNSCPPLLIQDPNVCWAGNADVVAAIGRARPETVILFAAWTNYGADWAPGASYPSALRDTIRAIKAAGVANVLVLGPAPYWEPRLPVGVMVYWRETGSLPDRLPAARQQTQKAIDSRLEMITVAEGARFVSIAAALCNDAGCLTHVRSGRADLISWDNGHFTTSGARFVAEALDLKALVNVPGVAD